MIYNDLHELLDLCREYGIVFIEYDKGDVYMTKNNRIRITNGGRQHFCLYHTFISIHLEYPDQYKDFITHLKLRYSGSDEVVIHIGDIVNDQVVWRGYNDWI